jgi:hypothetical protein
MICAILGEVADCTPLSDVSLVTQFVLVPHTFR